MNEVITSGIAPPSQNENNLARDCIEVNVLAAEPSGSTAHTYLPPVQINNANARLSCWQERAAKKLMMENLDCSIQIATVAKECCLSRSHFSRAFKNTTGHSPRDWLQLARMTLAKKLLEQTDFSVSHVGFECGFADQPHFTRMFTRNVGMTPRKWRLNNRL